jgi:peptide/nickel transport system ATP-binding protein/glutathione transport system ATP-binding protein
MGSRAAVFEDPRHPYTRSLLEAVPVADPAQRRLHEAASARTLASPIFPLDYRPAPSTYEEVSPGHFVLTPESGALWAG